MTAEESRVFKWEAIILDDQPRHPDMPALQAVVEQAGFACEVAASDLSGLRGREIITRLAEDELLQCLRSKHLIVADMLWQSCGDAVPSTIDGKSSSIQSRGGLSTLCNLLLHSGPPQGDSIGDSTVGLWLSAAISHENTDAEIVFKSSSQEVTGDPKYLALEYFADAPFVLLRVPSGETADPTVLPARLVLLQRRALTYSEDAKGWLIAGVLLPKLLGFETIRGCCGPLRDMDDVDIKWELGEVEFFPQLRTAVGVTPLPMKEQIELLIGFIDRREFRLASKQREAIHSVVHSLKNLLRCTELTADDYEDALTRCSMAGFSGQAIFLQVQEAKRSRLVADIRTAIRTAEGVLENSTKQLDEFCVKHGGCFDCVDSLMEVPQEGGTRGGEVDKKDRLPFDHAHLVRAVDALYDNLKKKPPQGGARHELASYQTASTLTVAYRDNSEGFAGLDNLATAVKRSLNKTSQLDRGLPLALSFPFYYPLTRLEVLMNTGEWVTLYPAGLLDGYDAGGEWHFGVRWTFTMDSSGPSHAVEPKPS